MREVVFVFAGVQLFKGAFPQKFVALHVLVGVA